MKKIITAALAISLLSSCAMLSMGVFRSGVQIPAGEEFLLGEGTSEAFKLKLENTCYCDVPVETRNADGEKTSGFGLAKRGTVELTVAAGEYAVLKNPHGSTVTVNASFRGQVYGMRYQDISSNDSLK